jgi:hypothetical protein
LEKAWNQTKKALGKIKGKGLGTQQPKWPHHIYLVGSKRQEGGEALDVYIV